MKYFILSNATDKKEIGKIYPQCKGVPKGYSFDWYDDSNSMTKLTNEEFPKEKPALVFELDKKAKLTDVISPSNISARGFLMNEKVKDLLVDFNIINHKIYSATLFANRQMYDYFWFHPVKNNFDGIDFKKSEFIEADIFKDKIKDINVNSIKDYNKYWEEARKDINFIIPEKLVLTQEYKQLDIFFFPLIHQYLIVSENFIKILQEQKIIGFEYKEVAFIS